MNVESSNNRTVKAETLNCVCKNPNPYYHPDHHYEIVRTTYNR